jgi:hypothetical protein
VTNPGYPNVIAARADDDDTPKDLTMPTDFDGLKVALYVWNSSTLGWERMVAPRMELIAQTDLLEQILLELKIMNKNMSNITDTTVTDKEIET